MFKINGIVLFIFFQMVNPSEISSESKYIFYKTHDRILEIIDNVFISLRIDENLKKSKNIANHFSMHNYIQDEIEKNEQVYQNIRSILKTELSNKTAYSILNVSEVIDESIRKLKNIINKQLTKNNSNIHTRNDEFLKLARDFHLKNISIVDDLKSLVSDLKGLNVESRNFFKETTLSTIERYPFMASVHISGLFTCAGSLIREDLVMSAASCLIQFVSQQSDVSSITARVSSDYAEKFGDTVPVANLIFHANFNPANLNHNLVVIRLERQVRLEKQALLKYQLTVDDIRKNVEGAFILGWGGQMRPNQDDKNDDVTQKLTKTNLELYDSEDCMKHYTSFYINDHQFCAGMHNKSSGACKIDIGGPAIVGSTLVGIISFSSPFCDPSIPTVFTKTTFYTKWIDTVFETFPLQKQLEPTTNPSAYGDSSQERRHDEFKLAHQEEPHLKPNTNAALNLIHNIDNADPFKRTAKPDDYTDASQEAAIYSNPNLIPTTPVFNQKQTGPMPSHFSQTPEQLPPLTAGIESLNLEFVNNVFNSVLTPSNSSETSKTVTSTKNTTIFSTKPTSVAYEEHALKSTDLETDSTTTKTPFIYPQNVDYPDEINEDFTESETEYENESRDTEEDMERKEEKDNSNVEVMIKELGTIKRFFLDTNKADARNKLAIIKEQLSNYNPDMLWVGVP